MKDIRVTRLESQGDLEQLARGLYCKSVLRVHNPRPTSDLRESDFYGIAVCPKNTGNIAVVTFYRLTKQMFVYESPVSEGEVRIGRSGELVLFEGRFSETEMPESDDCYERNLGILKRENVI